MAPVSVERMATAATRLAYGASAGVLVGAALSFVAPWEVSVVAAWDVTAIVFLAWVWITIVRLPDSDVAAAATREDENRAASDAALVGAAIACLVAVGFILLQAAKADGLARALLISMGVLSVFSAWGVVHTVFVLRYASIYYEGADGGVDFNDDAQPNFTDFAYLAFTVGMTYQVSDTDITTREMRGTVLRHALLSFLFGTFILAMMINVVAGLLH